MPEWKIHRSENESELTISLRCIIIIIKYRNNLIVYPQCQGNKEKIEIINETIIMYFFSFRKASSSAVTIVTFGNLCLSCIMSDCVVCKTLILKSHADNSTCIHQSMTRLKLHRLILGNMLTTWLF